MISPSPGVRGAAPRVVIEDGTVDKSPWTLERATHAGGMSGNESRRTATRAQLFATLLMKLKNATKMPIALPMMPTPSRMCTTIDQSNA